jgi:hypothetical protein
MTDLVSTSTDGSLPALSDEPVTLDAFVTELAKYNECTKAIKYWTEERDRVVALLTERLGEAEEGTVAGQVVFTYRRKDGFNSTRFKKDHPDLARMYTRTVEKLEFDADWFKRTRPELFREYQTRSVRNEFNV